MPKTELVEYISGFTSAFFGQTLGVWMDDNRAFLLFVGKYKDKIRAKARGAKTDSDLRDLLCEMEIGQLFLKNPDLAIEYEPYGTGNFRSPDYLVSRSGGNSFNVEARRIREALSECRYEAWERKIREAIRGVPSQLGVYVNIRVMHPGPDLLDRLEVEYDRIKMAILEKIVEANGQLKPGESCRYPIAGFGGIIDIKITRPMAKANPRKTSYYGGNFPIWFTQREFTKFGDIVCEKLGQLRPGMVNVLAVCSQSDTHCDADCEDAIGELACLAKISDNGFFRKKGFEGTADFISHFADLSAIVFRSSWIDADGADRNYVWLNPHASHPLDGDMSDYLRRMD